MPLTEDYLAEVLEHHAALKSLISTVDATDRRAWVEHANFLINAAPDLVAEVQRLQAICQKYLGEVPL
jgi:hypothetical protein